MDDTRVTPLDPLSVCSMNGREACLSGHLLSWLRIPSPHHAAEGVAEMLRRGWQGRRNEAVAGQLERLSPFPRDGKVRLIWKELPVLWSWQRARCLPCLVHFKIHCLAFNSLSDLLLEALMTDCSQNNTQLRFFQLRSAESCYLPSAAGCH